jgi:DNA-binding MarR family transcriptional regulator
MPGAPIAQQDAERVGGHREAGFLEGFDRTGRMVVSYTNYMSKERANVNGSAAETDELGVRVRAAIGRLYRRFRSERTAGDLGDTAFEVLSMLYKNGPLSLTALAEHAGVATASMSQSVNRLTGSGYAVRLPDPGDRRKVLFETTPRGTELARDTRERRNAWLDAQLAALSAEDRATVARACAILDRMARDSAQPALAGDAGPAAQPTLSTEAR